MTVECLFYTPIEIADEAIGECWDTGPYFDRDKLENRMTRVANKSKHASTIEHLYYNFHIWGVSRALLQELARHRIASPTVKSTRYTLKELKGAPLPTSIDVPKDSFEWEIINQFVVLTPNRAVNQAILDSLNTLKKLLEEGISNDIAKYALPEAYKTSLVWSINARSLQNFLQLRTSKAALPEIQALANLIYDNIPEDHKFLFREFVPKEN